MKIYAVGGAIRDLLLGLPATDRDYVVVGSSPEEMHALGFVPVGKDFPVFLHPRTKEEYALARTERKSGQGYKGFSFFTSPEVTLEQDLMRRDFTINAMAQEVDEQGVLIGPVIDPYGGQADLKRRMFRHIGASFQEDPLRILRLARFLARFKEFSVDTNTLQLVREMVQHKELQHLVPERVWQEFSRGLLEIQPSRMLNFLNDIGVKAPILPNHLSDKNTLILVGHYLDRLAAEKAPLANRLAILVTTLSCADMDAWFEDNKVPIELREVARTYSRLRLFLESSELGPTEYMQAFEQTDLWRKPKRFMQCLDLAKQMGLNIHAMEQVVQAVQLVSPGQVAKGLTTQNGSEIAKAVYQERFKAIASAL